MEAAVIGHQAVHFALDIGSLSPDTTAAGEQAHLILQLAKQNVRAVVPSRKGCINLVGLIDGIDRRLVVPKAEISGLENSSEYFKLRFGEDSLFNGNVVSKPTKFSLEPNSGGVKGARIGRVERSTALGIGIVVVILEFCQ